MAVIEGAGHAIIGGGGGKLLQVVHASTGAYLTGTTQFDLNDGIPFITGGTEFLTATITPTNAANRLIIEGVIVLSPTAAFTFIVALFQDTTVDALAAVMQSTNAGGALFTVSFRHEMAAGTTSATTFRMRAGLNTSGQTTRVNGTTGRLMGGVSATTLTIYEIGA